LSGWHPGEIIVLERKTLVLLHPGGVMHSVWLPFIRHWSTDYQIVAPDLYHLDGDQFSTKHLAQTVVALVKSKDIESATFIGSSLGANVALQIAIDSPSTVRSLVADSAQTGGELPIAAKLITGVRFMPTSLYVGLIMSQFKAYSDEDRQAIRSEIRQLGASGFVKAIQATHDIRNELGRIGVPLLLTNGDKDPVLPQSKKLLSEIPQAEQFIIKNSGHSAFLSQHTIFIDKVTDFLKVNG
jgi:pimeloyl-ACP methyl ester carboxylesterase